MTLKRRNSGKSHTYTLDNKKVEGVTTLIGRGLPKPALPYWAARSVAEYVADVDNDAIDTLRMLGRDGMVGALKGIPWARRDTAAVRGTDVHKLAEALSLGEEVTPPDELAGHVDACASFLDTWRPRPVLTEAVIGSRRHQYAGTLDLVADLPDGRRAIFDYKTSASGIWPETALQLAAYRYADFYLDADGSEKLMDVLGINCAYAVWLRTDGYDVYPVNTSETVFDMFRAVAYVARRAETMQAWIGEAELWVPQPV